MSKPSSVKLELSCEESHADKASMHPMAHKAKEARMEAPLQECHIKDQSAADVPLIESGAATTATDLYGDWIYNVERVDELDVKAAAALQRLLV